MREDHQEILDKMFPDGWGLLYTCPDGQIRWAHFNPHDAGPIHEFYHLAMDYDEEDDD